MSVSSIMNANTHRVKEGARVLEDVARFLLKDDMLFKKIRHLRHSLQAVPLFNIDEADLGGPAFKEENVRSQLINLVQANALRIQEALRVLEELSQNLIDKQHFKSLRYTAYAIAAEIYQKILIFTQRDCLKGVYLIINADKMPFTIEETIHIINQSSVQLVQLRNKSLSKLAFIKLALQLRGQLQSNKLLIINDYIDLALDIAEGVHLGQADYMIERVRKILPERFILGVSCHTQHEAIKAYESGASYISVGALFPTKSKEDAKPVSLSELERIRAAVNIPLCAIGGMHLDNLNTILSYKVDMIATISAVWENSNPLGTIEAMQKRFL